MTVRRSRRRTWFLLSAIALLVAIVMLLAPLRDTEEITRHPVPAGQDSVLVAAGSRYGAGSLRRVIQGKGYRDLWALPIWIDVLDLRRTFGGLVPLKEGGGKQTLALHLRSRYGQGFTFRSIDKEITRIIPSWMRHTLLGSLFQDHTSAGHPVALLVAAPLQAAVGLPAPHPRLVVLPADSLLGEFHDRFAGLIGVLQEAPDELTRGLPGVNPALPVLDTEELFTRLDRNASERIDVRGFLTARLLDFLVNDWDRHQGQWRWVGRPAPGGILWQPIPVDRDQAFARYDGFLLWLARLRTTRLSKFGTQFPPLEGLTRNSASLNVRVLQGLPRAAWDSIAGFVTARLTDSVIDAAVSQMPEPYWRLSGLTIAAALKQRRAGLTEMAGKFYELVVGRRE